MTRKLVAYVRDACRDSDLTPSARALAVLLSTYSLATGECTVSQAELGDVLGVSRWTLQRATRELEHAGVIAVARSTMGESTYRFPVHPSLTGLIPNGASTPHGYGAPAHHDRGARRGAPRGAPVHRGKEGKEVKEPSPRDEPPPATLEDARAILHSAIDQTRRIAQ